jgi:hypothetical protein
MDKFRNMTPISVYETMTYAEKEEAFKRKLY